MLSDQDKKEIVSLFSNAFAQGVNELIAPDMGSLLETMGGLKDRMGTLEGRMGTLEGRMGTLEGRMGTLEGRMGTLEGRMGTLEDRMGTLEGRIITLDDRMVCLETKVDRLGETSQSHSVEIMEMHKKLDIAIDGLFANKDKLDSHEERITKLEMQMAL